MKPDLLRAERIQRGWSQAKLAEELGVDMRTVRRWERGQAIPFPYYRQKLSTLFGKPSEELGLPPDDDSDQLITPPVHTAPSTLVGSPVRSSRILDEVTVTRSKQAVEDLEASLADYYEPKHYSSSQMVDEYTHSQDEGLTTQQQPATPLVGHLQVNQQAIHTSGDGLFMFRSLWDVRIHMRRRTPSQHPKRPLWSLLLITSTILVTTLITLAVLPGFYSHPSPKKIQLPENYGPPSYTLTIPTIDPSLQDTALHLQQAFSAVYPQLVNRFALDPVTAPRNVTLTFSPDLSSPATTSGTTIILRPDWIQQHPSDVGLLTEELTHMLEQYPSGSPAWFGDGMAAYARTVYGPADDDWSLSDNVQPQDNYTQGGEVAARFLLWLEQYTRLDIVDQLNHALQTKINFSNVFHQLTHHSVDALWNQYKSYPVITLLPDRLYKTATSRKPVYQSSFHVQAPKGRSEYSYIQRFSPSNFTMQAEITIVHGNGGAGFFFRDESDANYLCAFIYPSGWYALGDQDHWFTDEFSSAIKQGQNQTNQLTIVAQKHTFYIFINTQFITQVDNNNSNYGPIGPMVLSTTQPTDVQFKHLQVF